MSARRYLHVTSQGSRPFSPESNGDGKFVSADKDKPVGMDPLCLLVDVTSGQEIIDHLQQADVEIFLGPVERQGSTSVYVYDPDGVHVELRLDQTA